MPTVALVGFSLSTAASTTVYPPIQATASLTLSGWAGQLKSYSGSGVVLAIQPKTYRFRASGHSGDPVNGVIGTLTTPYSYYIRCGGKADGTISDLTLNSSGTATQQALVQVALSGYSYTISGTADWTGRVQLILSGKYPHSIIGGAQIVGALSGYTKVVSGTRDAVAQVQAKLHAATLNAHGYADAHAEVVGILPALRGVPSAVVVQKLPRPTLLLVGTTGAAATYEAYSLTFIDTRDGVDVAATRYTTYPFNQFLRFDNKYYGVGDDGLFELTGNLFDTAPIVSVVELANTDFGTPQLKRPISLYIAGEVGADFKVTVNSAEVQNNTYTYRPVNKTGARNYRVFFGKGIRARYLGYKFTNTDGGDFVLDDISPEFVVTRRTA